MAGLVPATHAMAVPKDVDARDKPARDGDRCDQRDRKTLWTGFCTGSLFGKPACLGEVWSRMPDVMIRVRAAEVAVG